MYWRSIFGTVSGERPCVHPLYRDLAAPMWTGSKQRSPPVETRANHFHSPHFLGLLPVGIRLLLAIISNNLDNSHNFKDVVSQKEVRWWWLDRLWTNPESRGIAFGFRSFTCKDKLLKIFDSQTASSDFDSFAVKCLWELMLAWHTLFSYNSIASSW